MKTLFLWTLHCSGRSDNKKANQIIKNWEKSYDENEQADETDCLESCSLYWMIKSSLTRWCVN